eukprot:TRINITY_DN6239_c0_g1_i3.p1 TRINITY_DN6239_c0_g1~~TRINITY_DN6239_c0_g1_i3.p1  ORF type:complete len:540 (+),score=76.56 TRINITY_DN6239_c0_g1_i3:98-1621(+)
MASATFAAAGSRFTGACTSIFTRFTLSYAPLVLPFVRGIRFPHPCLYRSHSLRGRLKAQLHTLDGNSTEKGILSGCMKWPKRTDGCGELSEASVGRRVTLCGWVALHRIHGSLTFFNLRDHTGVVQIMALPEEFPDAHSTAKKLRLESVVAVEGTVRNRPEGSLNPKMKTGSIEVSAETISLLNPVRMALPFLITTSDAVHDNITEEVRLRYRYLDLRRGNMNNNIRLRHKVCRTIRRYLEDVHDFVEIETPILSKSTPEGARDYLVPSRVQPGEFYALPQSPQLYKQMLMVSGFEKYYQIARCFRDEDLRADRQPEFTQLDMELSFTSMEEILKLNEDMIRHLFQEISGISLAVPFTRLTYTEAMDRYGSDRPDLRYKMELINVSHIFANTDFKPFVESLKSGSVIKALVVPSGSSKYSNTNLKKGDVYNEALKAGAKGLPFLKVPKNGNLEGIPALTASLEEEKKEELLRLCAARPGDLIVFSTGKPLIANKILGSLSLHILFYG